MTGRRVHERFACDLPVFLSFDGQEHEVRAVNISLGGVYVLTELSIPYGTELSVRLRVPALKEDAHIAATARWAREDGIGLQFGSLRAMEVWALNQFFRGLTTV